MRAILPAEAATVNGPCPSARMPVETPKVGVKLTSRRSHLISPLDDRPNAMLGSVIRAIEGPPIPLPSLARVHEPDSPPLRIGVVQHRWVADGLAEWLAEAVAAAARRGARIVFLPEVTLSRYPADTMPVGVASDLAEDLESGPTLALARAAARENDVHVHASLYRRADEDDGLGLNTAIIVNPTGELVAAESRCPRTIRGRSGC